MEKKTDRVQIKIQPSVKAAAQELAAKDGRTLSNYIVNLLQVEIRKSEERKMKYYVGELYSDKWGYGQEEVFGTEAEAVEWLKKEWDHLTEKEKKLQDIAYVYEIKYDGDLEEYREYNILQDLWSRDVLNLK